MPPSDPLSHALNSTLQSRRSRSLLRRLSISPQTSTDFSSNDFLSLSRNSDLRSSYFTHLTASSQLGSGGSRLLDGNSTYAEELEKYIAGFHRAESALLFNSGYDANTGLFSSLPQKGDVIVYDEYIHASVHEGMKLSRAAKKLAFRHNDMRSLEAVLKGVVDGEGGPEIRKGEKNVFVAVESVYSMDGDIAPISKVVDLVEEMLPLRNAYVIVDEAHSTGVFGPNGRGIVNELGLEDRIFARVHTFGKALACNGAVVLCSGLVREYLINYARSLIYTTAMSFPALASIRTAYEFMANGHTEELRRKLNHLTQYCHSKMASLISRHFPAASQSPSFEVSLLSLPHHPPSSPILSILTPFPRELAHFCQTGGFVVRAIMPPTIPKGAERVRVCLHAGNTEAEVDGLVSRMEGWVLEMKERGDELVQAKKIEARL